MDNLKIINKAKRKAQRLKKLRSDSRYLKTVGKLKREGFLDVRDVVEYRGQVFLEDALWAAKLEPRIYELLPAIIARRPKLFVFFELPKDLEAVVKEIKKSCVKTPYQGVAPEKYSQWISLVSRKNKVAKVMKAFRLCAEDLAILDTLSQKQAKSRTEILHQALVAYAKISYSI